MTSNIPIGNLRSENLHRLGVGGYGTVVLQGWCGICHYSKTAAALADDPVSTMDAERKIFGGHDFETACPAEPAITVISCCDG